MNKYDLPGYNEAINLGYSLYCHQPKGSCATYNKGVLGLTIYKNGTAKLTAMYKMVILSIESFSFPNKNIKLFEEQILKCIPIKL